MPGKYIQIGEILTCYCDAPLAKRTGQQTFQIIRFQKGEKIEVEVLHGGQGVHTIGCPKCGYKYTCIGIMDTFSVTDEAKVM